jgi:hypothetical protein
MKKLLFIAVLMLTFCMVGLCQSSTSINVSSDPYDWHKIIVSHFVNKTDGVNAQFWYKQSTDQKRTRLSDLDPL